MAQEESVKSPERTFMWFVREVIQVIGEIIRDHAKNPFSWAVLMSVAVVVMSLATQEPDKLRNTPAGAFALSTVEQCLSSGPMIGAKPTNAACINETIAAAKNLRGEQFAEDVKAVLASKFAPK